MFLLADNVTKLQGYDMGHVIALPHGTDSLVTSKWFFWLRNKVILITSIAAAFPACSGE